MNWVTSCLSFEFHFSGQDTSKIQSFSSYGVMLVLHATFLSSKNIFSLEIEG